MSKYLELFKGAFDDSIGTKTKPENKPYIGYSLTDRKLAYTVVPKPVKGPDDNEIWYTSSDGNVVTPSDSFGVSIVSNEYNNGKGVITFDGDVTSIGDEAFSQCFGLTSVIIPNSVTSIGGGAFASCPYLTSITISENVTSIGGGAFNGCFNLASITIPNSVTSIGEWAFTECVGFTTITIPNSVTSIGNRAFYSCSSLTSITFQGTIEQWNAISKGSDWNDGVPATEVICTDGTVTL